MQAINKRIFNKKSIHKTTSNQTKITTPEWYKEKW